MTDEVNEPILNSPFDEPYFNAGKSGTSYKRELVEGHRPSIVYQPRKGNAGWDI
jgi:type III restriction enzyme